MANRTNRGHCLCGQVKWSAREAPAFAGYCYCSHCRRLSGAGRSPFVGFRAEAVSIVGATKFYADNGDANAGIARHFCPTCGTRLFSIPGSAPEFRIFYAGSLDDGERFKPEVAIHIASKVDWETLPLELVTFEGDAPADG